MILRQACVRSNGGHQDDTASTLEVLVRRLSNEELSASVEVENTIIDSRSDILNLLEALDAGVGHDNVQSAKVCLCIHKQLVDLVRIRDVGLDSHCFASQSLNFFH